MQKSWGTRQCLLDRWPRCRPISARNISARASRDSLSFILTKKKIGTTACKCGTCGALRGSMCSAPGHLVCVEPCGTCPPTRKWCSSIPTKLTSRTDKKTSHPEPIQPTHLLPPFAFQRSHRSHQFSSLSFSGPATSDSLSHSLTPPPHLLLPVTVFFYPS